MFSNEKLILPFKPAPTPVIDSFGHCLLAGSCFANSMGDFFEQAGFSTNVNPFGTLFNPVSIAVMFRRSLGECSYDSDDFVLNGELWHTWEQHTFFSDTDPQTLHLMILDSLENMRRSLKGPTYVFITLGSSWVHELKENSEVVANCHKHPADQFDKRLLSEKEIQAALDTIYEIIKRFNSQNRLILTISPVRHSREGLIENNRSKARLIESVHAFIDKHSDVSYFPAYEIMIDHLRDYRFYDTDLVHPSSYANELVFRAVNELLMTEDIQQVVEKVDDYRKLERHRPRFKDTDAYHQFELKKEELRVQLLSAYPQLDL
jgi:lysophospholipase L1-like esterase